MNLTFINSFSETCFKTGAIPFNYQMGWAASTHRRNRVLTKMRQCGADWFFSLEALSDALATGRNQIFLGCGDGHSQTNRAYISALLSHARPALQNYVSRMTDFCLELTNGAHIYFIDPDSHCAAIHGNVYASEYAWADSPKNMIALAKGLSMHARYHATYYTTPSPSPEAWQEYKKLIASNIATSMIFTAEDAATSGATFFDDEWLNTMKGELSAADWRMLFMCEWLQFDKEQMA
ncbi:terminase family protein [Salmonella enterica]|nr:terminase-like family protein [Salmonella enterica subsp. enterica serovar Java]EBN4760704.1 terminase-like family protein [Salmonella enterica]ECA4267870.1 terminase-like family protein [Salmonella enterica subsp. enterica serovar Java]ECG4832925.1 terminase-like family protein [Salmonella enterica subsp. enterica serovar Java]EEI9173599.1 terminase-like family protein [Salmonella enterica subsp. enterica serovar Java]